MDTKNTYDLIIIGSGGAGCAAALEAKKKSDNILILTKSFKKFSKTANAQGGLQASFGDGDSAALHFEDTMKAGNFKSDPALVKILTERSRATVEWLENLGVFFDRTEENNFKLKTAAGVSIPRVLSCGDSTGNKIVEPILKRVAEAGIEVQEDAGVKRVEKKNGIFTLKVQGLEEDFTLTTRALIIATGGLLPKEKRAGLALGKIKDIPDGVSLAEQLGATCVHPDLMQYHPTGIILPKALRRKRLPETMRGAGARILNKNKEVFIDPLTTRNKLTQAIVETCNDGMGVVTEDGYQGVWLITPDLDKIKGEGFTEKNYPTFYNLFLEHGHDLTKEPVLVYPIVHYGLGGIEINEKTETSVEGLFSAGETTWGVHGEERLMGNSLLDIFVFGRIAGQNAIAYALNKHE